jgi:hypothetical protein
MCISHQSDNLSTPLVVPLSYFDRGSILFARGTGAELRAVEGAHEKQWQRWLSKLSNDELSALARGLSALINVVKKETEQLTQQSMDFEPCLRRRANN